MRRSRPMIELTKVSNLSIITDIDATWPDPRQGLLAWSSLLGGSNAQQQQLEISRHGSGMIYLGVLNGRTCLSIASRHKQSIQATCMYVTCVKCCSVKLTRKRQTCVNCNSSWIITPFLLAGFRSDADPITECTVMQEQDKSSPA